MLERTMRRVALSVRPERTATVVVRGHRQFYAPVPGADRAGNHAKTQLRNWTGGHAAAAK